MGLILRSLQAEEKEVEEVQEGEEPMFVAPPSSRLAAICRQDPGATKTPASEGGRYKNVEGAIARALCCLKI
jgi:hypothetical protein